LPPAILGGHHAEERAQGHANEDLPMQLLIPCHAGGSMRAGVPSKKGKNLV